ncbi:vacuolar protein sorting-associated protein 13c [Anaeramoeba flamelloides]|uniref:Vacuolar protein sorting-associated protein 13c n=1 Tax=Anaeramoeba flamelloides TaxID=1746091 RepID=A0AAV7ZHL7_9EUKA|nr:vacuolar protein sorting-associated protein 13c [Anaeramoeba flamelloides]
MLRKIVSSQLNKYLGDYVKKLDKKQLKIGLWGGDVELHDLELKTDSLNDLKLPIQVKSGFLGSLILKIPWKSLGKNPVKIELEEIFMVTEPLAEEEYDPLKEKERLEKKKQSRLAKREEEKLLQKALNDPNKNEQSEGMLSLGSDSKLLNKIINNIQVSIKSIHIRHEDSINNKPFAFGITLDSLEIASTDQNWKKIFIEGIQKNIFKLLSLSDFSIYWDFYARRVSTSSIERFKKSLHRCIPKKGQDPKHDYLISPINSEMKLKIQKKRWSSGDSLEIPQFDIEVTFDELIISLSSFQYAGILAYLKKLNGFWLEEKYLKFGKPLKRPKAKSKKSAIEWWKYAYRCTKSEKVNDRGLLDWPTLMKTKLQREEYIPLWKTKLEIVKEKVWDKHPSKLKLAELEREISYEYIVLFRSIAEKELEVEAKEKMKLIEKKRLEEQKRQESKKKRGWFSRKPKKANFENDEEVQNLKVELDGDQIQNILQEAFGVDETNMSSSSLQIDTPPPEYSKMRASLKMNSIQLRLFQSELTTSEVKTKDNKTKMRKSVQNTKITDLEFNDIKGTFLAREGSQTLMLNLGSILVNDFYNTESQFPCIIKPRKLFDTTDNSQTKKEKDPNTLLSLQFDLNPLDGVGDSKVTLDMKPLEIVYNPYFIDQITKFFVVQETKELGEIENAVHDQVDSIVESTNFSIHQAVQDHKTMNIQLFIKAPVILIPGDVMDQNSHLLVLDLGNLQINSKIQQKEAIESNIKKNKTKKNKTKTIDENLLYDKYEIKLSKVHSILFGSAIEWIEMSSLTSIDEQSDLCILKEFEIKLRVQMCILPQDLNLTTLKIDGTLPLLAFQLSSNKYIQLMTILNQLLMVDLKNGDQIDNTQKVEFKQKKETDKKKSQKGEKKEKKRARISHGAIDLNKLNEEGNEPNKKEIKKQQIVGKKKIELHFDVKRVSIKIKQTLNEIEQDLIHLTLSGMDSSMVIRSFDKSINLKINSFQIHDLYSGSNGYLISSVPMDSVSQKNVPVEKDFITISLMLIQKNSPEFKNVEMDINAIFSQLFININRKTVNELIKFYFSYQIVIIKNSIKGEKVKKDERGKIERELIKEKEKETEKEREKEKKLINLKQMEKKKKKDDIIKMRITGKFEKINLILAIDSQQKIAEFNLACIDLLMALTETHSSILCTLKALSVFDITNTQMGIYKNIIHFSNEESITFKMDSYLNKNSIDYPGYDSKISLNINGIQVIFLNRFLNEIITFFDKITKATDLISSAKENLNERATQALEEHLNTQSLMLLDININNIQALVPQNSYSKNIIIASIKKISIQNEFINLNNIKSKEINVDKMNIDLHSIEMCTGTYNNENNTKNSNNKILTLISPINLNLVIERSLDPLEMPIPEMNIKGLITNIQIMFNQRQLEQLLSTVSENLGESTQIENEEMIAIEGTKETKGFKGLPLKGIMKKNEIEEIKHENDKIKLIPKNLNERIQLKVSELTNEKLFKFDELPLKEKEKENENEIPKSKEKKIVLNLSVELQQLSLEIINGEHIANKKKQSIQDVNSIAEFAIHTTTIQLEQNNHNEMSLNVNLTKINVLDKNINNQGDIKNLILIEDGIRVQLGTDALGNLEIDTQIHSLDLICLWPSIFDLIYFFAPPDNEIENAKKKNKNKEKTKSEKKSRVEKEKQIEKEKSGDGSEMKLNLKLNKIMLILPEDSKNSNSPGLILEQNFTVNLFKDIYDNMEIQLGMNDITIFRTIGGIFSNERESFILPYSILLNLVMGKTLNADLMEIKMNIKPLNLIISYRDILMGLQILNDIQEAQKPKIVDNEKVDENITQIELKKEKTEEEKTGKEKTGKKIIIKKEEKKKLMIKKKSMLIDAITKEIQKRKKLERFIFEFEDIKLTLIDDCISQSLIRPLFSFSMKPNIILIDNWSTILNVNIQKLIVDSNYYNFAGRWEPFLEPWFFNVEFKLNMETKAIKLDFNSPIRLKLNVSSGLLRNLNKTIEIFYNDYSVKKSSNDLNKELSYEPFWIVNQFGTPFEFWIVNGKTEKENEKAVINPGEKLPVKFIDKNLDSNKQLEDIERGINRNIIKIHFPMEKKQLQFSYDQVKREIHLLNEKSDSLVISDINIDNGSRILTVNSKIQICNETKYNFNVVGNKKIQIGLINENKTLGLNDNLFTQKNSSLILNFTIENNENKNHSCDTIDIIKNLKVSNHQLLFKPRKNNGKPLAFILSITKEELKTFPNQDQNKSKGNVEPIIANLWKFTILPSLKILNTLPFPVCFALMNSKTHMKKKLQSGEFANIYQIDCFTVNQSKLHITIPSGFVSIDQTILEKQSQSKGIQSISLLFKNKKNPKRTKKLTLENILEDDGTRTLNIFSKYWLINRTGLGLIYRGTSKEDIIEGQSTRRAKLKKSVYPSNQEQLEEAIQNYERLCTCEPNQINLRAHNSKWSEKINLNVPQTTGVIPLKHPEHGLVEIGMKVERLRGVYNKSMIVTFTPRFLIFNKTSHDIYYKWFTGSNSNDDKINESEKLLPDTMIPIYALKTNKKLMNIAIKNYNWSSNLIVDGLGNEIIKLYNPSTKEPLYLNLNIKIEDSITLIYFTPIDSKRSSPRYLLKNETNETFKIVQKGFDDHHQVLMPNTKLNYYWDDPKENHILLISNDKNNYDVKISIDKLKPILNKKLNKGQYIHFRNFQEGPTKMLIIRASNEIFKMDDDEKKKIIRKDSDIIKEKEMQKERANGYDYDQENKLTILEKIKQKQTIEKKVEMQIDVNLKGFGFSFINNTEELFFFSLTDLLFKYLKSNMEESIQLNINHLQIDDQTLHAINPIILEPKPSNEKKDVIMLTLYKSLLYGDIDYFSYASFLLQTLIISLHEDFLLNILEVIQNTEIDKCIKLLTQRGGSEKITLETKQSLGKNFGKFFNEDDSEIELRNKQTFFELLHLNPIQFIINFQLSNKATMNPITNLLRVIGASFTSIHDANLNLNSLLLKDFFTFPSLLTNLVIRHYKRSFLKQTYNLVAGLDLLGAPVNLFTNCGQGLQSFFVEPAKGFVESPEAVAKGLGKGSWALISGSIKGIFGSASGVIDSVGSGVSVLSLDDEFKQQRSRDKSANKPKNLADGIFQGGKSFGKGLWSGVSGIVAQPIKGYKKEGGFGMLKGVGKGLVGVVAKPTVGVTDLASNITSGMKNTTTIFDAKSKGRVRPPRFFDGPNLTVFQYGQSLSHYIVNTNTDFKSQKIIGCAKCEKQNNSALMITDKYIVRIENYKIIWSTLSSKLSSLKKVKGKKHTLSFGFKKGAFEKKADIRVKFDKAKDLKKIVRACKKK